MLQKYEKMDYRVQLMRIFACFIVIGCHVRLEPVINGGLDKELLLLHGFYDDGVTIFFMIMGFFLVAKADSILKSTGKTFLRILVPVLLLRLFISVFHDWILQEATFPECLSTPDFGIQKLLNSILTLNFSTEDFCGHLWYITSYLQIIILLPFIRLAAGKTKATDKVCCWIIFINVLAMLITDLQVLFPSAIQLRPYMIFDASVTYVIIGYVLYQKRHLFEGKRLLCLFFFLAILFVTIVRFVLQCTLFERDLSNTHFYYWNTSISLLFGVCFVCFFLTFSGQAKRKYHAVINYMGAKTYVMYLLHMMVYTFLDHRGVRDGFYAVSVWRANNLFAKSFYNIAYPLLIFVCCLSLCFVWDYIKYLISSFFTSIFGEKNI